MSSQKRKGDYIALATFPDTLKDLTVTIKKVGCYGCKKTTNSQSLFTYCKCGLKKVWHHDCLCRILSRPKCKYCKKCRFFYQTQNLPDPSPPCFFSISLLLHIRDNGRKVAYKVFMKFSFLL